VSLSDKIEVGTFTEVFTRLMQRPLAQASKAKTKELKGRRNASPKRARSDKSDLLQTVPYPAELACI